MGNKQTTPGVPRSRNPVILSMELKTANLNSDLHNKKVGFSMVDRSGVC
jgi:hypothetical protein